MLKFPSPAGAGGNLAAVLTWSVIALQNAAIPFDASITGAAGARALDQLAAGEIDVAVSLHCAAWQAYRGSGIYRDGALPVAGLALAMHPGHHFFHLFQAGLGIRRFEDIARVRPQVGWCMPPPSAIGGQIIRALMRQYEVDLDRDVPAWGGEIFTGFYDPPRLFAERRAGVLLRENTRLGPAGAVAQVCDVVCLSLDAQIADSVASEYGTPVVTIPAGSLRGQSDPVRTISNLGYPLIVRRDMPFELAYSLAKALNESSATHAIAEEVFYSIRHAPDTGAPLHPGAERYYRDAGVRM